jgi:hypothetical protein
MDARGRIVVIFKDNKVSCIERTAPKHIVEKHYNIIAYINKPFNFYYVNKILEYYEQHPEKIMIFYLTNENNKQK